ncbi:MAG: carbohydrate ABC transporter permease [Chloroflexota bacterium]
MRAFLRGLGSAARLVVLAAVLVWSVFPFWWAATYALKPPANLFDATVLPFLQFQPTAEHWRAEMENLFTSDGLGHALITGTEVALGVVAVCLLLGLSAAAGLVRMRRGDGPVNGLLGFLVLPRLLLPIVLAIPFFLLGRALGLHDTRTWLVMNQSVLALPFAVVILQEAARAAPAEIFDAAQLDGASWLRIAFGILPPLIAPAIVAAAAIAFSTSWNEYLFAMMNHARNALTPPVAIMLLDDRDGIPFAHVGSHLTLVLLPPLLLTIVAQRFIVRGIAAGALQGT